MSLSRGGTSPEKARCTALLLLAVLLLSCAAMGRAARGLEETALEDNYPAEAPESSPDSAAGGGGRR